MELAKPTLCQRIPRTTRGPKHKLRSMRHHRPKSMTYSRGNHLQRGPSHHSMCEKLGHTSPQSTLTKITDLHLQWSSPHLPHGTTQQLHHGTSHKYFRARHLHRRCGMSCSLWSQKSKPYRTAPLSKTLCHLPCRAVLGQFRGHG